MKSAVVALLVTAAVMGCGGDDDDAASEESFVADIRPAIEAVEAELGAGQQYFEVTANELVTNLFVAVDDATAAVPYVFLDGELQPPAPKLTGASGFTFDADAVAFDEETVLVPVREELTDSTIESFSIEGGAGGVVRYVVSTLSPEGGRLDVTVAPDGRVLEVDPL